MQKNTKIWVAEKASSFFQIEWFDHLSNSIPYSLGHSGYGRQPVIKFNVGNHYMVLRHYCRGGLPAKFSKDKFVFSGWSSTRAYQELILLEKMTQLELPVPHPIASRSMLEGLIYSSDIIMHEILHAKTLAQMLTRNKLSIDCWAEIGRVIKKFHTAGIEHVDLNANNILIDRNENLYLIDFDRCLQRDYSYTWGKKNLNRLKRSLIKTKNLNKEFYYSEKDFQFLCKAYDG
ncbi:MAG: 3-deoxy-D-manno-octulosonic acid kinase [Pseudomonadota bacterium]